MLVRQLTDLINENTLEKEIPSEFFKYLEKAKKEDPSLNNAKLGELPDKFLKDSLAVLVQDVASLRNAKGDSDPNVQKLLDLQVKFNFVLQKKPKAAAADAKVPAPGDERKKQAESVREDEEQPGRYVAREDEEQPGRYVAREEEEQPGRSVAREGEEQPGRYVVREKPHVASQGNDNKDIKAGEAEQDFPHPGQSIPSDLRKMGQSGLTQGENIRVTRSRYDRRNRARGVSQRAVEFKTNAALPENPENVCFGTRSDPEGRKYVSLCIPGRTLEEAGFDVKDPEITNQFNAMLAADAKFGGKEITRNVEWKREAKGDAVFFIADFVLTGDEKNDGIQKGRVFEYSQKLVEEFDILKQIKQQRRHR